MIARMGATAIDMALDPDLLADVDNVPVVRLREYLADAKRQGRDFASAWAFGRVRAVHGLPRHEKTLWLAVLDETQHEWRNCYTNTTSSISRLSALQRLTSL